MATLFNKQNVAIGVAYPFVAHFEDFDTATFPNGPVAPDLDDLVWGDPWPDPWIYVGATVEGATFSVEPSSKDIPIEESPTPALTLADTTDISITTELAEDVLQNLLLAYGGGGTIEVIAPGATTKGLKKLHLSSNFGLMAAGMDMKLRNGKTRRIMVPQMNSTGKAETSYRRSDSARTYPIEMHAVCEPEDVEIVEEDLPATGGV